MFHWSYFDRTVIKISNFGYNRGVKAIFVENIFNNNTVSLGLQHVGITSTCYCTVQKVINVNSTVSNLFQNWTNLILLYK